MKIRCVFDASCLISSVLSPNNPNSKALFYAIANGDVITSEECFQEFAEVIFRKKFDKYFTQEERRIILLEIEEKVSFIDVKSSFSRCRDPKDDKYLQLAFDGKADFLITGDQDLLVLNPFHETRILSPSEFLLLLEN